ncbi:hypothetical protein DXE53_08875 [Escherichia coli O145]|nr:hypothetical protein DXE53_08875 [Escherichia coli O145]
MCIVFDYPRTLAQRSLPVGLRSLLMREYSDDTAHPQNLVQALECGYSPVPLPAASALSSTVL